MIIPFYLLLSLICVVNYAQQDGVALMKNYDYDKSSSIDRDELLDILDYLEISSDLNAKTLETMLDHVFNLYDKDKSNAFELEEFIVFATDMRSPEQRGSTTATNPAKLYGAAMRIYEKKDPSQMPEVARLFRKAADLNHAPSQHSLGAMYYNGEGVERDEEEAIRYFREAAKQDYIHSMFNLGIILFARGTTTQDSSSMKGSVPKSKPTKSAKFKSSYEKVKIGSRSKHTNSKEEEKEDDDDDDDSSESYTEMGMKKVGDIWKWLNGELGDESREMEIHEAMEWLKRAAEMGSQFAKDKLNEHAKKLQSDYKLMAKYSYSYSDFFEMTDEEDDETASGGSSSDLFRQRNNEL